MTPAARLQAVIVILNRILGGEPAEKALTGWARASRYAGSGDRAAVRDQVFDILRSRRSSAAWGGAEPATGRSLAIGFLRARGEDLAAHFSGEGYGPVPLSDEERTEPRPPEGLAALDCPEWLGPMLRRSIGGQLEAVLVAQKARAPVFLRANLARTTRPEAIGKLAAEGIAATPGDHAPTVIEVKSGASRIRSAVAYLSGLVELQDASSQAAAWGIPLGPGDRVLDFCAGGGGKTLALAGRGLPDVQFFAHDAQPGRMRDLPPRAARAGATVTVLEPRDIDGYAPFDLVLADVPCSGTGTWRRDPAAKWSLTPDRLAGLVRMQVSILESVSPLVRSGGRLAYLTCSLLAEENEDQIATFLARNADYALESQQWFSPVSGGDGFFSATLTRG